MTIRPDLSLLDDIVTSPCCRAFNAYVENMLVCSRCNKVVKKILGDEILTTGVYYNVNKDSVGSQHDGGDEIEHTEVSDDMLAERKEKMKRCANDITLELVERECPECKAKYVRFFRDLRGNASFVCPNRHVFN